MHEQPKPEHLLHSSASAPAVDRHHSLEVLVGKFAAGGCCGKRPTLTLEDLDAAGLTPIPGVFVSAIGQIVPRSGWRAMCVYVYETIVKKPFPVPEQGEEWGGIVADGIKEILRNEKT